MPSVDKEPTAEFWVEIVRKKVGAMRFGSVQITIHDGRVTLVESTEKTRVPESGPDTQKKKWRL